MPNGPQTENHNPFMNTSSAMSLGYAFAMYEPLVQVNLAGQDEAPLRRSHPGGAWNDDYTAGDIHRRGTARSGATVRTSPPRTSLLVQRQQGQRGAQHEEGVPFDERPLGRRFLLTVDFTDSQRINNQSLLQIFASSPGASGQ